MSHFDCYLVKYSYDISDSNSFVLLERISRVKVNYHWIKCSAVRSLAVSAVSRETSDFSSLPVLDVATMEARAKKSDEKFHESAPSIGIGVTREAQEIFNSLSKTMPCVWRGTDIVCFGVKISPPYTSESCQGSDSSELDRVRKVLDGEKQKR